MQRGKQVSYVHNFEAGAVLRVRFIKERGRILEFVVQLECFIGDEWHPILRYDTAHDFPHCDVLHPDGTVEKSVLEHLDYNDALTFSQFDLQTNWRMYRERYERWMKA